MRHQTKLYRFLYGVLIFNLLNLLFIALRASLESYYKGLGFDTYSDVLNAIFAILMIQIGMPGDRRIDPKEFSEVARLSSMGMIVCIITQRLPLLHYCFLTACVLTLLTFIKTGWKLTNNLSLENSKPI